MYGVDDGEAFTAHVEPGQAAGARRVARPDAVHDARRGRRTSPTSSPSPGVRRRGSTARRTPATSWSRAPSSRRTPRRPARPAACGRSRRCASPAASPGSAWTPTTGPSPTRPGWIGTAVHLDKGCYRGQETVARVHTLGRPPRRLTMLHLDGSDNRLPARGSDLLAGRQGGRLRRHQRPAPRARADRARRWSSATCLSTPRWSPTGSRPTRRSSSTPRRVCTCGPPFDDWSSMRRPRYVVSGLLAAYAILLAVALLAPTSTDQAGMVDHRPTGWWAGRRLC